VIVHHYAQFVTGPDAPGSLQPRSLFLELARRGHEVVVVAGDLNAYNEKREPEEMLRMEGGGGLTVRRVPSTAGFRRGLRARLRTYLGYAWRARRLGLGLGRPDLVVGSIQPLFTGLVALRAARRQGVPFLLEVRDLWPDALEAKGALTGAQAAPLYAMASYLYRSADRIVSLTPGIKKELIRKGIPGNRIDVFTNGFDPEIYRLPEDIRTRTRADLGWGEDFVAIYTGTHVEVTAVDVIVRAAAALRERSGIRFELFGQGQRKAAAMRLAGELGLTNIRFNDPVPKRRVPELLAAADVGLMTLFESPLIDIYFENKLIDYMGAGLPILAAMGGQQAELIRREGAGLVVPSFDHVGLAGLVETAAQQRTILPEMGRRGRRFAQEHLLLPGIVSRYADVIEATAAGRAAELKGWDPF
jgi:glycosyltransferase involved in cell wall biosynthesis